MIQLTRQYRFAASHRLHSPALPDAENEAIYGKCNNPYGHGHDYVLQVAAHGEPDRETGLLMNLHRLDEYVHRTLVGRLSNANLNCLPEFASVVPTTENLARMAEDSLRRAWPREFPALLGVRVLETARNSFESAAMRKRDHEKR